ANGVCKKVLLKSNTEAFFSRWNSNGTRRRKAQPKQTWSQLLASPACFSRSVPSHRCGRGSQQKRTASILRRAQQARNCYRAFHSPGRPPSNHRGRILAQRQTTL